MPKVSSRRRRGLIVTIVTAGGLAAAGAIWFLFFPVPMGWAVNLALRRALPPEGEFATIRVTGASFRYRILKPTIRIDLEGVTLAGAAGGQLTRRIDHVELAFSKAALWRRNWLPALVKVSHPVLLIDLSKPGTGPNPEPAARNASPHQSFSPSLAALQSFLPLPDNPCRFVVRAPALVIKMPGRTVRWQFRDIATTFARHGQRLQLNLPLGLARTRRPVEVRCEVEANLRTGLVEFHVVSSGFNSENLPHLPFIAGEIAPPRFRFAFKLGGVLLLSQLKVEHLRFDILADGGVFHLPRLKRTPIYLRRLELRGQASDDFRHVRADTAILDVDSLRLDASGLDVETGPNPHVQAAVTLTGPTGSDIAAWLPRAFLAAHPLLSTALREFRLASLKIDVNGSAHVGAQGLLAARALSCQGGMNVMLGSQTIPLSLHAAIADHGKLIEAHLEAPLLNPARMAVAQRKEFALFARLNLPVRLDVVATGSPAGSLKSVAVTVHCKPGRIEGLGTAARGLPIRSATATVRFTDPDRTFQVPLAQIDFDGPTVMLRGLTAAIAANGTVAAHGTAEIDDVSGNLPELSWPHPARVWLTSLGLQPADLRLKRIDGSFAWTGNLDARDFRASSTAGAGGSVDLFVQGQPMHIRFDGSYHGASGRTDAKLKIVRFQPDRLNLTLPGGLDSSRLAFPVGGSARVVVDPAGLQSVSLSFAAGPGTLRANRHFAANLPIRRLSFEARTDGRLRTFHLDHVHVGVGGITLGASNIMIRGGSRPRISGTMTIAGTTRDRLLRLWPVDWMPAMRARFADSFKAGALTRAGIRFVVPLNLANPGATRPTELIGEATLNGLQIMVPGFPSLLTADGLVLDIRYPEVSARLGKLAAQGIHLTSTTIRVADLAAPAPRTAIGSYFTIPLSGAVVWIKALGLQYPTGLPIDLSRLAGSATGEVEASLPLQWPLNRDATAATIHARVSALSVPFAASGTTLGGGELALSAQTRQGDSSVALDWRNLALRVPHVFSGRISVRMKAAAPKANGASVQLTVEPLPPSGPSAARPPAPRFATLRAEASISPEPDGKRLVADLKASSTEFLGTPLAIDASATLARTTARLQSAAINQFRIGRTDVSAAFTGQGSHPALIIKGSQLDVAGLLRIAAPFIEGSPPPADTGKAGRRSVNRASSTTAPPRRHQPPAPAWWAPERLFGNTQVSVTLGRIDLGERREVDHLSLSGDLTDGRPVNVRLRASEDGIHPLALTVIPRGRHQAVTLTVSDVAGWLEALTEPAQEVTLPPGTVRTAVDDLRLVPVLLSGGNLKLNGDLRLQNPAHLFDGNFRVDNMVMQHPPRILQLVALKSGRALRQEGRIRSLSVRRFFLSNSLLALEGIKTRAAIFEHLKVNYLRYGLSSDGLHADGEYFGIGFSVLGTRADPQVYLRNNLLIRMLGARNEWNFGNNLGPVPPPPPRRLPERS